MPKLEKREEIRGVMGDRDPESMAWELGRKKVEHELVPLLDGGHCGSDLNAEGRQKLYDRILEQAPAVGETMIPARALSLPGKQAQGR